MADKLSRLLETESELDAMLERTRGEAAELVSSARADAEERIRRFEAELEAEERALRDRVAREGDEAITAIRAEAERNVKRLEGLDEEAIGELAHYVVRRLVDGVSGGRR